MSDHFNYHTHVPYKIFMKNGSKKNKPRVRKIISLLILLVVLNSIKKLSKFHAVHSRDMPIKQQTVWHSYYKYHKYLKFNIYLFLYFFFVWYLFFINNVYNLALIYRNNTYNCNFSFRKIILIIYDTSSFIYYKQSYDIKVKSS